MPERTSPILISFGFIVVGVQILLEDIDSGNISFDGSFRWLDVVDQEFCDVYH